MFTPVASEHHHENQDTIKINEHSRNLSELRYKYNIPQNTIKSTIKNGGKKKMGPL